MARGGNRAEGFARADRSTIAVVTKIRPQGEFGLRRFELARRALGEESAPRRIVKVSGVPRETIPIDLNKFRKAPKTEYLVVVGDGSTVFRKELLDNDLGNQVTVILLSGIPIIVDIEPLLEFLVVHAC